MSIDVPRLLQFTRRMSPSVGRRALLVMLTGIGPAGTGVLSTDGVPARKKRKRKKVTLCRNGQRVRANKHKAKRLLNAGATRGACTACLDTSTNLQAAIDTAQPGATLTLCAGVWILPSTLVITKSLTLAGAGMTQTLLDGGDAVRALLINGASTVALQDLTITRGNASSASVSRGGGIDNQGGAMTLRSVSVTNCAASIGGGIHSVVGSLVVEGGSQITGNTAIQGGGIFNGGAATLAAGSLVSGNTVTNNGAGIFNLGSGTLLLAAGSTVTDNTATNSGGGIFSVGDVILETGSNVTGNDPNDCDGFPVVGTCG